MSVVVARIETPGVHVPERAADRVISTGAPKLNTNFAGCTLFFCPPRGPSLGRLAFVSGRIAAGTNSLWGDLSEHPVGIVFFAGNMSLRTDLIAAGRKAGGSHLTREAREGALNRFSKYLADNNIQLREISHIKERHIKGFLASRDVKERVKQNELSALRVALRAAGRETFADHLNTQRMGVQKASRNGTHRAIRDVEFKAALEAARLRDEGVAAALQICRAFGLRSKEAVIADAKTLARWQRELANRGQIEVVAGTKGGRARLSQPANLKTAQNAIKEAREIAERNNGFLIAGGRDLKSALFRFHRIAAEAGLRGEISPHSLRYAYACDRVDSRIAAGFTMREAFVATSLDLGHGDGRGAYIKQVYSLR